MCPPPLPPPQNEAPGAWLAWALGIALALAVVSFR